MHEAETHVTLVLSRFDLSDLNVLGLRVRPLQHETSGVVVRLIEEEGEPRIIRHKHFTPEQVEVAIAAGHFKAVHQYTRSIRLAGW